MKISGVYRITNAITGDFYIGSSKDVKRRWESHKWPSTWNRYSNNPLYKDMQKYGVENFEFEILAEVEPEELKEAEQQFIEKLQPTYNNRNANGFDFERYKDYQKEHNKSDKYKEYQKEYHRKYNNQLCFYNGQTLTLHALSLRFWKQGISNPVIEAKKYII